ncbi:uncharacterized protein PHACADRAFT_146736 [Phanerochaete carnosa HHB-10118-sp]|uniref:FCP1 homology domain-containing protein n=1 Tax=Phanerochaete carnosa (strain HHB-10118-sp) TaxID=650164 RepID=K5VSW2_PHACS|nr:uncharacterized protein PHACADRAFT_146736 [Phanerochaete carnosa HHB-10118-sp]EKM54603.1 hypothetical protein PHACADRAFT_146736 [Phanerochaete carnosa HHB-10118-sp]
MASIDSAPASTKEQDSKGTEPEAAVTVTQPAGAQGTQNDTTQAIQGSVITQQTCEETPNGAVSASGDQPATTAHAGSAPSTSAQTAQVAAEVDNTVADVSGSTPALKQGGKADEIAKPKDAEKDRASLNTSTQTYARSPSTRQKETKSVSELAHTASTAVEEPKKSKTSSKKTKPKGSKTKGSLFTRIFHVFVPCTKPSSKAHEIDVDVEKPRQPEPSVPATTELKEKQTAKEAEELPPEPSTSEAPATSEVAAKPSEQEETRGTPVLPPLQPVDVPPPSDDPSVVVPPTPTKLLLPPEEGGGVLSGSVQPIGSTGDETAQEQQRQGDSDHESDGSTSFTDEEDVEEANAMDEVEDEEERLILNGGAGIPIGPDGLPRPLLPPLSPKFAGRKCLVLDLDETLVHSSFKSIQQADYVVPVEIEYHWHNVYVIKRPGVDNFLKKMGEIYEVVVFTASLSKYADPVLDKLDVNRVVAHRLFRESCYNHRGNYVKDLSQLGRPIADTIIIDNSPASYIFHPNNAVPVSSWFNDPHDTELTDLVPFLADLGQVDDVRGVLDGAISP